MPRKKGMGVRHIQAMLLWFCLLVNHIHQGNAGIVTVIMTKDKDGVLFKAEDWVKEHLFSVFYYAYPLTSILAGYLGPVINNKYCLLLNGLYASTASYMTPTLVDKYGLKAFYWTRLSLGLVQGLAMPQVYGLMCRWIPPEEFLYLGPVTLSGMFVGTFVISSLGGFVGASKYRWTSIFYFSGHCSVLWSLAFLGLGAEEPESCWYMSPDERAYVLDSLASRRQSFRRHVPLRAILACLPVYAVIVSLAAHNWTFQTIIKMLPRILYKDFGLSLPLAGLIMGCPFLLLGLAIIPSAILADLLLNKKLINVETLRFTANSIGQYGMGISLLFMAFSTTVVNVTVFYSTALLLASYQLMGIFMNHSDLAPNFAGFLFGWTLGVSHVFSSLGPYTSTVVYSKQEGDIAWTAVFLTCACINLLGNLFFMLFGSVNIQSFNTDLDND